eukprot:259361-Prymnesium_polylepis.1
MCGSGTCSLARGGDRGGCPWHVWQCALRTISHGNDGWAMPGRAGSHLMRILLLAWLAWRHVLMAMMLCSAVRDSKVNRATSVGREN